LEAVVKEYTMKGAYTQTEINEGEVFDIKVSRKGNVKELEVEEGGIGTVVVQLRPHNDRKDTKMPINHQ